MLTKKCAFVLSTGFYLFSNFINAQFRTTDFELVGKIKSVQSVCRPYQNSNQTTVAGFLNHQEFDSVYLEFDNRRNLKLRENYLDYQGKLGLFDRTVYQINPSNRIEKSVTTLVQNGESPKKISQKKSYYYLGNLLVRTDEFNSGQTTDQYWVANSTYKNGVLNEKVFWMEDAIFSKTKYEFDSNINPVSEKTIHNNGLTGLSVVYENDKTGMPIRIINKSGNQETVENIEYAGAYPLKKSFKDRDGKITETDLYNSSGRIFEVEKINYQNNKTDRYRFEYEFDPNNNWTNCKISKNGLPTFEIQRKISYYP